MSAEIPTPRTDAASRWIPCTACGESILKPEHQDEDYTHVCKSWRLAQKLDEMVTELKDKNSDLEHKTIRQKAEIAELVACLELCLNFLSDSAEDAKADAAASSGQIYHDAYVEAVKAVESKLEAVRALIAKHTKGAE